MSKVHEPTRLELICTLLSTLVAIAVVVFTFAPRADAAGDNWCGAFKDGYVIGYCWQAKQCDYIPPVMCPYPEDDQDDGYMVGLMSGLDDARQSE